MSASLLPCLHIGMPKTGTALLQRVFARHSGLHFQGKRGDAANILTTAENAKDAANIWMTPQNAKFVEQISGQLDTKAHEDLAHVAQTAVEEARALGRVPLWSKEGWSAGSPAWRLQTAKNLEATLGPSRVILVLRHPHAFVESLYFQKLISAQLGRDGRVARPGRYFSLEQWLEANWGLSAHGALANLDYARTAEIYAEVFGTEAIGIFLYEDLKGDSAAYARALGAFIGVDSDEMVAHIPQEHVHPRLTEKQIERIRYIDSSLLRRLRFRLRSPVERARVLSLKGHQDDRSAPASASLPTRWGDLISEFTADGNHRLMDRWDVSLVRHGYPL